jgi:hypothetical protein
LKSHIPDFCLQVQNCFFMTRSWRNFGEEDHFRPYPLLRVIMTEHEHSRNPNHNSYEPKQKGHNHSFFDMAWPRNIAPLAHPHRFCTLVIGITAVKLRFDAVSTQNELKYKGRGYIEGLFYHLPWIWYTLPPIALYRNNEQHSSRNCSCGNCTVRNYEF